MSRKKKDYADCYASTPYLKIPQGLFLSKEFNGLKPTARCIFLIMLGKVIWTAPNKPFVLTFDEMVELTKFSKTTVANAIKELMIAGFIEIPIRGYYPHNISKYKLDMNLFTRKYPKKGKPYPKYMDKYMDIDT